MPILAGGLAGVVVAAGVAVALPATDPGDLALPVFCLLLAELVLLLALRPDGDGAGLHALAGWLLDPKRGAARLLAIATAAGLLLGIALVAQAALASGFRHAGLVFAAYCAVLLVAAAGCALLAPALLRVWGLALRVLGDPTPMAALLVITSVAGGAAAWTGIGHGPAAMAPVGPVALFLAVQLGVAAGLSRRRR